MIHTDDQINSLKIQIIGRVQGVGFRPFVYRTAIEFQLKGTVQNQTDGVWINIQGTSESCKNFIEKLKNSSPPAAVIKDIRVIAVNSQYSRVKYSGFQILQSKSSNSIITEICPDIAVCEDCLSEMNGNDRRKNYPFINCTNCGPRFSIVDDFPYDRRNTSMHTFMMCEKCSNEYSSVTDRRFHAQPVSCPHCGPTYTYHVENKIISDFRQILCYFAEMINSGKVVAVKSLGGYNLICDATSTGAVNEIRTFKNREKKPLAVMCKSVETLKKYVHTDIMSVRELESWRRPIVILEMKEKRVLSSVITSGLNTLGVFLPYLPLHYLLFDQINTDVLVVTSGNESDSPILCVDKSALQVFKTISGGIVLNDRKIARRTDDSVVKIINDSPQIIRRSRGYAPSPVDLDFNADGIIATGAELSNCFCIGKYNQAILSQHIGDLKNSDTYDFFIENIAEFSRMYRFSPKVAVCDLHPDFLSSRYAEGLGLPLLKVQHHHAHIASVMAEHHLNRDVIGVSYDGTGYGYDGNIWGSETGIVNFREYKRVSHFKYIPMPGGDISVIEPWRSALAYLHNVFPGEWHYLKIPFLRNINLDQAHKLCQAIEKGINSPLSCSAGRLFDAVSALLGICSYSHYHSEAPMLLECHIISGDKENYPISVDEGGIISFTAMFHSIITDIIKKVPTHLIVTRFHNTMATTAFKQVMFAHKLSGLKEVVLSGGSFQNRYLTEKLVFLLEQEGFTVYLPAEISLNDGCIALGQLAVASHLK